MKAQPIGDSVKVEIDGSIYEATFSVSSKIVTVHSAYGSGATQIGGSGDIAVAKMLLREIISGAKGRGEL